MPASESARSPFAPRRRFLLRFRLRITVPGPLRFRLLAVPQTSWNLHHYALELHYSQINFVSLLPFSTISIPHQINGLRASTCCFFVDKTAGYKPVFWDTDNA
jgi:hypothetical protein